MLFGVMINNAESWNLMLQKALRGCSRIFFQFTWETTRFFIKAAGSSSILFCT